MLSPAPDTVAGADLAAALPFAPGQTVPTTTSARRTRADAEVAGFKASNRSGLDEDGLWAAWRSLCGRLWSLFSEATQARFRGQPPPMHRTETCVSRLLAKAVAAAEAGLCSPTSPADAAPHQPAPPASPPQALAAPPPAAPAAAAAAEQLPASTPEQQAALGQLLAAFPEAMGAGSFQLLPGFLRGVGDLELMAALLQLEGHGSNLSNRHIVQWSEIKKVRWARV